MKATPDIDYKRISEEQQVTIALLQHRLDKLEKMIFGSRHERFVAPVATTQISLDLKAEEVAMVSVTDTKKVIYTRTNLAVEKKPLVHPGRGRLPDHLRREDIVVEPDHVPEGSIRIGELITEQLECTQGELFVKRFIRYKYLLPAACEESNTSSTIITADLAVQPLEKSIAGPGLLAQILIDKFADHLPVHRQLARFERAGMKLPYSTVIEWVSGASKLLEVLYDALKTELIESNYLHADETSIKVLDQDKSGKKIHTGFFWVYNNSLLKLVFFDYQRGRNKEAPQGILSEFKGHLQTDGYDSYDQFDKNEEVIHLHCMAHARRYFIDAQGTDPTRSAHALEQIQKLYAIERSCKEQDLSYDERKVIRQEQSVPILDALGKWMREEYTKAKVLPKSPIGMAMAYSIKRWDKLMCYTSNGMLAIDNNPVENSLRPVALGRKNYLFCGSHEAAQRTAMIYSLLGSCKMQGVNPYLWLKDILTRISMHPINKIKELLPHHWKQLQVQHADLK